MRPRVTDDQTFINGYILGIDFRSLRVVTAEILLDGLSPVTTMSFLLDWPKPENLF